MELAVTTQIGNKRLDLCRAAWGRIGLGLNAEATRCKVLIDFNTCQSGSRPITGEQKDLPSQSGSRPSRWTGRSH